MDDFKNVEFYVIKYKTFSRKNGRTGQTISTRDDEGRKVDIDCCDVEDFDFSKVPIKSYVSFKARIKFAYCKGSQEGWYNRYVTLELCGYSNDIELS